LTDLIEIDLVHAHPCTIEDQYLVCVAGVRAKRSDIKLLVGPKHQALRPMEISGTVCACVAGEDVNKGPVVVGVKAQNPTG
jgi:hypothetical protein